MISYKPEDLSKPELHQYLLGGVAPRPIAFASTVNEEGFPNLSPFSFFNAFGVNPPTLVFSPSRRGRDNTTKHTYENLKKVPEVVINTVSWDIVQQMSLSSTEYDEGVNEFIKAGLSMTESEMVEPFRVKESPMQFECKVKEIIETGDQGGAGNLVICEILMIHMDERILDDNGKIDPQRIRLVGRMGGDFYTKAFGESIFTVEKPLATKGIGIDRLPENIRTSSYLTGNDLGRLGNIEELPSSEELHAFKKMNWVDEFITANSGNEEAYFAKSRELLSQEKILDALRLLMSYTA